MSIPGSGLLAALRRKTHVSDDSVAAPDEGKFAARSSAVAAIEHAVAAGGAQDAFRTASKGRQLPQSSNNSPAHIVYDLDELLPGEEESQLTFAPITRVPSEYGEVHLKQIAVSQEYITYGLKQGHIRVLHRFSEARALLKGHTTLISDICFVGDDVVAAGGQNGELYAWRLSVHDGDNAIHVEQILHLKFSPGCDTTPVRLAPISKSDMATLVIAVGNAVVVYALPSAGAPSVDEDIDPLAPSPAQKMPNFPVQDTATAVWVSSNGRYIAAGSKHGRVYLSKLHEDGITMSGAAKLEVDPGHSVSAVAFLEAASNSSGDDVISLMVATRDGSKLATYSSNTGGRDFTLLQSITLVASFGETSFIHIQVVKEQQLVVLADTPRKAVYTFHYSGTPAEFDYAARFKIGQSVLNFNALWNADAGDDGAIELNCVQTDAVQQFFLDPERCYDGGAPIEMPLEGEPTQALQSHAIVKPSKGGAVGEEPEEEETNDQMEASRDPPIAAQPSFALPLPSPRLANGREAAPVPHVEVEECPSPPSSPAAPAMTVQIPVPLPLPAAEEGREHMAAPEPSAVPQPGVSPVGGPTLLTPKYLMRSSPSSASSAAKESASAAARRATVGIKVSQYPVVANASPIVEAPASRSSAAATANKPDVSAAVAEEMNTVHRKFATHVSLMYKELLKAMKTEISTQAAAQQAATQHMLREVLAAQAATVQAERAAIIAEERASMERLLAAISNTLNQDLPVRLSEAVRNELSGGMGMSGALSASLAPAVQDAVAAALPKEIPVAVKAVLDKQLPLSLQSSLNKPIQEAFKTAFMKQLVPAFENACKSMFVQIDKTFTKGFNEHLDASKAALSEPVALASSLRESLAVAQSLADSIPSGTGDLSADSGLSRSLSAAGSLRSPKSDPRAELRAMVSQGRLEEAFSRALGMQDIGTVAWLCTQVDAASVVSTSPPALSQMVLLSLVQQLAADLSSGTATKLTWIREASMALNPAEDARLVAHLRPVLAQVHAALSAALPHLQGTDLQSCRLAIHVVNSLQNQ